MLAERPERAVAREDTFDKMTQHFTCIRVKAVNEFKTNIAVEKRRLASLFLNAGHLSPESRDPLGIPRPRLDDTALPLQYSSSAGYTSTRAASGLLHPSRPLH